MEQGEQRFARDGLEDLRGLMDALLPGRTTRGQGGEGPAAYLTRAQKNRNAGVAGDGIGVGTGQDPGGICCLNPQTLMAARGGAAMARLRVERFYHRSDGAGPSLRIFHIPRTLRGNLREGGRRVILNVEVKKRDRGPEEILRNDAAGFPEEIPLRPGNSSPREAEA